jgi:hypothetical protein
MNKNNEYMPSIVNEALEIADNIENSGGDEFTQWLAALIHVRQGEPMSVNEIHAAWESYKAFTENDN